ncbi:toll/interleukin-1 receptor domain-containing protein [Halomonas sp. DWK9]|uniref:toll/interleukin-1 receptor domain-containing protein n=1 Tax=Halomonas sp. DWK9 TaxID=3060155 RepID=UPI00287F6EB6|nr:toll/interleukin-1 receptor domain-containing protein [Halomonas sp. DWK9]
MNSHDAFLSYAGEDKVFASDLVEELAKKGLRVWFAPIDLKVGQRLLDSIESGMNSSAHGILLISRSYLTKGWPNYEMDTLIRQSIEKDKKIFPLWHNVEKADVEARHSGLAGVVAIATDCGAVEIANRLSLEMTNYAPSIGVIPSYESPKWRFLQGRGEISLGSESGPATTLWEFLIHASDSEYPLFIEGEHFSKEGLLLRAAQLLPHIPDVVENWVGKEGAAQINEMCKDAEIDPNLFA